MQERLIRYIEEDYAEKIKKLALEQSTSVLDILNRLIHAHFKRKVVCIEEFDKKIKTPKIQIGENIFECNKFEDLDTAVKFYKADEEVFYIEEEFFEEIEKGEITELIPLKANEFYDTSTGFIITVK